MPNMPVQQCAVCLAPYTPNQYRYATPVRLEQKRAYESSGGDGLKFALLADERAPWVCGPCAVAESHIHALRRVA